MMDVLTAVARVMAMENGASFAAVPGVAYDLTDPALDTMAQALLQQFAGTGLDLRSLRREDATLVADVDETHADEPLCPAAFNRVVHRLSYNLLGQVWEGKLEIVTPSVPAPVELVKVA
ncbi:MAG TPA: hypothetical protein VD973_07205 [Symbiobacteriaceae bacterium]|nr:hypothetical protein [Symbiobacteriaceae bacterium]